MLLQQPLPYVTAHLYTLKGKRGGCQCWRQGRVPGHSHLGS